MFESIISENLSPNSNHSIEKITQTIIIAAENSIPRTSGKPGRKAVPWWNKTVEEAIKKRRKALRHVRRLPDDSEAKPEALKTFQIARSNARKIVNEAKKNNWLNFIAEINPMMSTTELWRRINNISGKRRTKGYTLKVGSAIIEDPSEIAENLAERFAQICSSSNYEASFIHHKNSMEKTAIIPDTGKSHDYNSEFSLQELPWTMDKVKG